MRQGIAQHTDQEILLREPQRHEHNPRGRLGYLTPNAVQLLLIAFEADRRTRGAGDYEVRVAVLKDMRCALSNPRVTAE